MLNAYQKSALTAVNTADQSLAAGGVVQYSTNNILTGCAIKHTEGSGVVTISKCGLYAIAVNIDFDPTATGAVGFQLENSGAVVPGAQATANGTAGDVTNVGFFTLLKVPPSCCAVDNTASLTVLASAAATVTNAAISVFKLA